MLNSFAALSWKVLFSVGTTNLIELLECSSLRHSCFIILKIISIYGVMGLEKGVETTFFVFKSLQQEEILNKIKINLTITLVLDKNYTASLLSLS